MQLLMCSGLLEVLCSFGRIIAPLLGLGDGGFSDDFVEINFNLLVLALRCGEFQYTFLYLNLGIGKGGSGAHSSILVRVA